MVDDRLSIQSMLFVERNVTLNIGKLFPIHVHIEIEKQKVFESILNF